MKVTVIGTGHVGLVTCVTFASIGHDVIGTDVDSEKIELLARGVSPFYEAGLEEAMHTETSSGRLTFTVDAPSALREAEVPADRPYLALNMVSTTDGRITQAVAPPKVPSTVGAELP